MAERDDLVRTYADVLVRRHLFFRAARNAPQWSRWVMALLWPGVAIAGLASLWVMLLPFALAFRFIERLLDDQACVWWAFWIVACPPKSKDPR